MIGLDPFNLEQLHSVRDAETYDFHGLVPYHEIVNPQHYPMERLLREASEALARFDGPVDAIIGHWDFPTTCLLPLLRAPYGIPGPELGSVLTCENKYWSRLCQSDVIPECTPRFVGVDPFADDLHDRLTLDYPFWLKPVIAFSSYLGFRIDNRGDLDHALTCIRDNIHKFAEPFDHLMQLGEGPFPEGDGHYCVAEELICGKLCTLEGFVHRGEAVVYGVVDSLRGPNQVSFLRYQYPSQLPARVTGRMSDCARRVITGLGIDNSPFNMEFFWDPDADRIRLLEINPRISKSHCPLFQLVSGASHHEVAIDLALGRRPDFPRRDGRFAMAAKFMPRTYGDARVTRVPTEADVARARERFPELLFHSYVQEGMPLSDLPNQDSYSFELADIFLGGDSEPDLMARFRAVMDMLGYRFDRDVETNYA